MKFLYYYLFAILLIKHYSICSLHVSVALQPTCCPLSSSTPGPQKIYLLYSIFSEFLSTCISCHSIRTALQQITHSSFIATAKFLKGSLPCLCLMFIVSLQVGDLLTPASRALVPVLLSSAFRSLTRGKHGLQSLAQWSVMMHWCIIELVHTSIDGISCQRTLCNLGRELALGNGQGP